MVNNGVWAIILAAGFSSRMGKPKMLLPYQGESLVRRIIGQALKSQIDGLIVVVNPLIENLAAEADVEGVSKVILNDCVNEGMSSSIKAGLQAVRDEAKSVVFLLSDQPLMSTKEINTIIKAHLCHPNYPIVQATYQECKGHPVLFQKEMFPYLFRISGDEGGKSVIAQFRQSVYYAEMNREAIPDVDTPSDYLRLLNHLDSEWYDSGNDSTSF
ncbi:MULTISPECIES: NTP transferase domain-containing protein [unclassified Sporosarcina]|uniref:nucleotidyltransferase family protein n=1 Tax=unclassified Sporosarcina TaxID=2647733 RepID=UPI000C16612C|nr:MULTISPECIES: nucleotidyltransferase family protein [unclassified Sporosarcina]PID15005.1 4-diphosphocytidyl-2C-methyl-D-erythritol kinase [Sporosarcina sp. P34]PID25227.1 4-diphosphocytidyl-2C-methyl-D-erythritol kinase [Sporosarcina sp. P7]